MRPASDHPTDHGQIVDRMLHELEAGRRLERESLRAEFPERTKTVDRLLAAFATYRKLADGMRRTHGEPSGRLSPGTLLGDFEIESFLAGGGMGDVYRARQHSLGNRLVALKLIQQELTSGPEGERVRARFRREALASSRLHHPHLAEVFGFGEAQGRLFYAMRLVEGPTLYQVLERLAHDRSASMNSQQVRWIVHRIAEVASALEAVHREGLVHRDVKASNIMLDGADRENPITSDSSAVLVDFGLVQSVDPEVLTRTRGNAATHAYAPPELLLGKPVDARADVFSLGVTLHDLLSRTLPRTRDQAGAGLEPISELVPQLSPDLCAIASKAADPHAAYRYPDGGALAADLRAWLQGRPVAARHPGRLERTHRRIRTHPVRSFVGLWIAILVTALLTVAWLGAKQVLGRLERAEHAADSGSVMVLKQTLEDIQDVPGIRYLMSDTLREAHRRHQSGSADALVQVTDLLARNDHPAALLACVTALAKAPNRNDPLLKRFLLSQISRDASEAPELLRTSLMLTARLMMEQPDLTREAVVWSAPFRERLEALIYDPTCPAESCLYAISALASCGVPSQVERLMEFGVSRPIGSEDHRLSLIAAGSILLRSRPEQLGPQGRRSAPLQTRILHWMQKDRASNRLTKLVRASKVSCVTIPWSSLLVGLFLHLRDRGETIQLERFRDSFDPLSTNQAQWLPLSAAAQAPEIGAWLATGPWDWGRGELVAWIGQCIQFGDPRLLQDFPRDLVYLGYSQHSRLESLRSANAHNEPTRRLVRDRICTDLDSDSLLGSDCQELVVPLPESTERLALTPELPTVAKWRLSSELIQLAGWAGSVRGKCVAYQDNRYAEKWRNRRLFGLGTSWIAVNFTIPTKSDQTGLVLILNHTSASRSILPDQGVVDLRVTLDDRELDTTLLREPGWVELQLNLNSSWMTPGDHAVRISLQPRTTTVYWLKEVRLERRELDR